MNQTKQLFTHSKNKTSTVKVSAFYSTYNRIVMQNQPHQIYRIWQSSENMPHVDVDSNIFLFIIYSSFHTKKNRQIKSKTLYSI